MTQDDKVYSEFVEYLTRDADKRISRFGRLEKEIYSKLDEYEDDVDEMRNSHKKMLETIRDKFFPESDIDLDAIPSLNPNTKCKKS